MYGVLRMRWRCIVSAARRWVLGIVGALVFVGGIALAAVEFGSGGGPAGLFGGSGLGAFGLFMVIVAKDGEL